MTNKITLSRELVERIVKTCPFTLLELDYQDLRAALADPVPPAGGEPEILGWVVTDMNGDFYFSVNKQTPDDTPLVDCAHVTRLQAEVEQWKRRCQYNADTAHDLQTEVERLKQENGERYGSMLELANGVGELKSELTKARELLKDIQSSTIDTLLHDRIDTVLSNQSAPADKGQGEPVADYPSAEIAEEAALGIYDIDFPSPEDEQPAPVAVVMPERMPGDDGICTEPHYAKGWNACLDEVARLNGIEP